MAVGPQVAGAVVKTATGGTIAAGIWTLVGIALTTIGVIVVAWFKNRGSWQQIEQDGDAAIRSEMRQQMEGFREELSQLKASNEDKGRRLGTAEFKIGELTQELGQHRFLLGMVLDEMDRVSPGNVIAKQIRKRLEEMQRSYREASPAEEVGTLTEQMAKLCKVPGVGEEVSE